MENFNEIVTALNEVFVIDVVIDGFKWNKPY